ncbi:hypothetical protein VPHK251G3_0090 [Vibrio phage K251 g3]
MGNIVQLREKLTFGKHAGLTGAELLKSAEGTGYLKWLYNNTDVQLDMHVVNMLAEAGLVDRKLERLNSRAGGGVAFAQLYRDATAHAHRNVIDEDGEGNLTQLLRSEGVQHLPQLVGRQVRFTVNPTTHLLSEPLKADREHKEPVMVSLERGREIINQLRTEHGFDVDREDLIKDNTPSITERFRQRIAREVQSLAKDI